MVPSPIVTLPASVNRIGLVQTLRSLGYRQRIAVSAQREASQQRLRELGVDVVFDPFRDAAERACELLMGMHRQREIEIIDADEQKELVP